MSELIINRKYINTAFSVGVSRLVYFNTNGLLMECECTRDKTLFSKPRVFSKDMPPSDRYKRTVVNLFDVKKQEWRGFFISNVVCVEVL